MWGLFGVMMMHDCLPIWNIPNYVHRYMLVYVALGLGTQRWGSADFNGPDESACHAFMDRSALGGLGFRV